MRRKVASAVVLAAVAAVAVAAIVDAVRPRPAPPLDREAAAQLAELGVTGTLVYTDAECALQALSLPELRPAGRPTGEGACEISVSPDGSKVGPASVRWSGDGSRQASCGGACAWRGNELTRVRDREIVGEAGGVLVPPSELERAALSHPNARFGWRVEELQVRDLAWLSQDEAVALIEARYDPGLPESSVVIAGFVRGRLVRQMPYFGRFDSLVVSPDGEVAPEPLRRPFPLVPPGVQPQGAFDWSPDGRLLAITTRASIFVVEVASQRRVRIPVTARDLAWR